MRISAAARCAIAIWRSSTSKMKAGSRRFREDQNVLPGQHAYSHLNSLCSAMQSYFILNERSYLRAAHNGFRMIEEQSFATGGWGPNEAFRQAGQRYAGREPDQDALQLRDAMRRLRPLQDHALFAAGDGGQPLRRQHGARALQHASSARSRCCRTAPASTTPTTTTTRRRAITRTSGHVAPAHSRRSRRTTASAHTCAAGRMYTSISTYRRSCAYSRDAR